MSKLEKIKQKEARKNRIVLTMAVILVIGLAAAVVATIIITSQPPTLGPQQTKCSTDLTHCWLQNDVEAGNTVVVKIRYNLSAVLNFTSTKSLIWKLYSNSTTSNSRTLVLYTDITQTVPIDVWVGSGAQILNLVEVANINEYTITTT